VALIILSFCSSFFYAYLAAYADRIPARQQKTFDEFDSYFEFFFLVDMLLHFFEEYHYPIS